MIETRVHIWKSVDPEERLRILRRPHWERQPTLTKTVAEIIETVKAQGDAAVREFTQRFDRVTLGEFLVSDDEFRSAFGQISIKSKQAIGIAKEQIEQFHRATAPQEITVQIFPGLECRRMVRSIENVGLYIPGGTAPLPSTVLMLGVPALIAGCQQTILCSPPGLDGTLDPHILYAAQLCGIRKIFKVGGAQAIAAMAYGTARIPKVDKIFGPGNAWVSEAKAQVSGDANGASIDMVAGPSELLVVAQANAVPAFVAADLLSQAEHGTDSQVVLISPSRDFIDRTITEIENQLRTLPRKEIASACLSQSIFIEVENLAQAISISNRYAPEHLILHVDDANTLVQKVQNAGSVFLGKWSPEAMGDYASGTNHVLPTYGLARCFGGVSVDSFTKAITVQSFTPAALKRLGPTVEHLASLEGLHAHERAVSIRLQTLRATVDESVCA
jgi:histidinol dehydrogenase